jgi:PBP1b-binding outer membrane lipoprotein LpoB
MSRGRSLTFAFALLAAVAVGGCTAAAGNAYDSAKDEITALAPKDVKTQATPAIKQINIDRIAILPLVGDPPKQSAPLAPGASDAITAELYSQAALAGGWQVVPLDDVTQALQNLPPSTPADLETNAFALGRLVAADGALFGTVERYEERVGIDDSDAKPAAVTFSLKFMDMTTKQVVWTSKYSKTQKGFAQSLKNLVNFAQKEGRWIHAQEVAEVGVEQSVADLHRHLTFVADSKHFETGTYGQLKSGQQRYNQGMGKAGLY